jgi:hypothetical protein
VDPLEPLRPNPTADEQRLIHLRGGRGFAPEGIAVTLGLTPSDDPPALAHAARELESRLEDLRSRVRGARHRALGIGTVDPTELGVIGCSTR